MTRFVTIVSANYLAFARVLGDSVARHAPASTFRVLVVDRRTPDVEVAVRTLGLDALYVEDLGLPDADSLFYKYDILELNTAVKPTFLKAMFAEGHRDVVYLDPDTCLYGSPEPVLRALDTGAIVVTPHADRPVLDGERPSDIDFLRNGTFNLGFVALRASAESRRFLDWWEARCLHYGFNDTAFGTFVDQRWVDLAPCYFPSTHILRHAGCNLGYWNLHGRVLARDPRGVWSVDSAPLVFFHFSGVRHDRPDVLSKHQSRHSVARGSALEALLADYCSRLIAAGHERLLMLPYGFGRLDDGTPITATMRRALLCQDGDRARPFMRQSSFQRTLVAAGITPATARAAIAPVAAHTTRTFDTSDRRVRLVNGIVRLLARTIGTERVLLLVRYMAFLSRESHFASVLLDRQPVTEHGRPPFPSMAGPCGDGR